MDDMRHKPGCSEEDCGGVSEVVEPADSLWKTPELSSGHPGQAGKYDRTRGIIPELDGVDHAPDE